MLRHDSNNVIVFNGNNGPASTKSFFNGSYNTMMLDFDPLVNGYSFFKWIVVPSWVTQAFPDFQAMTEKNFLSGFSIGNMTLETTSVSHGFAANEYNIASNMKKENTEFGITHREFSGSPIRNMYQYWVTGIRDPETGIATYPRVHGVDYAAKNHTGEIVYIVTRPDANNVGRNNMEFSCYYTAVMPTIIKLDHFAFTHGTHEATEYEQTFKGVFHMSSKVDAFAKQVLDEKVYGFMELGEFDPTSPDAGKFTMDEDFIADTKVGDVGAYGYTEVDHSLGGTAQNYL